MTPDASLERHRQAQIAEDALRDSVPATGGPMARICVWCVPPRVLTPGTRPATSTLCAACAAALSAAIEASPFVPTTDVPMQQPVTCGRCGRPRDLAIAPRCFVCRSEDVVPIAPAAA